MNEIWGTMKSLPLHESTSTLRPANIHQVEAPSRSRGFNCEVLSVHHGLVIYGFGATK